MYSQFGLFFSFLVPFFVVRVSALTGSFSNPPASGKAGDYSDNVLYKDGDTVKVNFTVNVPTFNVVMWQNGCREFTMIRENTSDTQFDWKVDVSTMNIPIRNFDDVLFGNVGYLGVLEMTGGQPFMTSHYFNLSDPNGVRSPVPTTTSKASSSTTATSTPTKSTATQSPQPTNTANPTQAAAAQSPSSTDTPVASTSLSPGAAAGIAIGIILGIALGAVGATLFILKKRTKDNNVRPDLPPKPPAYEQSVGSTTMSNVYPGRTSSLNRSHAGAPYGGGGSMYKAPLPTPPAPVAQPGVPVGYFQQQQQQRMGVSELSPEFVRHEVPAEGSMPLHELPNYPSS